MENALGRGLWIGMSNPSVDGPNAFDLVEEKCRLIRVKPSRIPRVMRPGNEESVAKELRVEEPG